MTVPYSEPDRALALAVYRNYCQMWREVGAIAPVDSAFEVQPRADMLLVRSRYSQRVPHMVLDPQVRCGEERDWTSAVVRELAVGPVSLMISLPPGGEHDPLAQALLREGFLAGARPQVAMSRPASQRPVQQALHPEIGLADSEAVLGEARALLALVFGLPAAVFAFYTPLSLVRTYVLRVHDSLVGAACLCPFAGSAGIYSVGILPSNRGRGYARWLVERAISDAAMLGLGPVVLSCDRSLVPLYARLGFVACWEQAQYWLDGWRR